MVSYSLGSRCWEVSRCVYVVARSVGCKEREATSLLIEPFDGSKDLDSGRVILQQPGRVFHCSATEFFWFVGDSSRQTCTARLRSTVCLPTNLSRRLDALFDITRIFRPSSSL